MNNLCAIRSTKLELFTIAPANVYVLTFEVEMRISASHQEKVMFKKRIINDKPGRRAEVTNTILKIINGHLVHFPRWWTAKAQHGAKDIGISANAIVGPLGSASLARRFPF